MCRPNRLEWIKTGTHRIALKYPFLSYTCLVSTLSSPSYLQHNSKCYGDCQFVESKLTDSRLPGMFHDNLNRTIKNHL